MSTRGRLFDKTEAFKEKQRALLSTIAQMGDVLKSARAENRNLKAEVRRLQRLIDRVVEDDHGIYLGLVREDLLKVYGNHR